MYFICVRSATTPSAIESDPTGEYGTAIGAVGEVLLDFAVRTLVDLTFGQCREGVFAEAPLLRRTDPAWRSPTAKRTQCNVKRGRSAAHIRTCAAWPRLDYEVRISSGP